LWLSWLEVALAKIAWAGDLLHEIWVATLAILVVLLVFGIANNDLAKQISVLSLARVLILPAVGLLLMVCAGILAVAIWWLRTLPGERLRSAVLWVAGMLPFVMITIIWVIASTTLDTVMGKGMMSAMWPSAFIRPVPSPRR
jgi:hypothetical protein